MAERAAHIKYHVERFELLCTKIDEAVFKWRPFFIGASRFLIKVYDSPDAAVPVQQREATRREVREIAMNQIEPLVLEAIRERWAVLGLPITL